MSPFSNPFQKVWEGGSKNHSKAFGDYFVVGQRQKNPGQTLFFLLPKPQPPPPATAAHGTYGCEIRKKRTLAMELLQSYMCMQLHIIAQRD
jgi:hypothetical protein